MGNDTTVASTAVDSSPRPECEEGQTVIVVAVLTYQRPELLNRLVEHFSRSAPPDRASIKLVVIDNDRFGSAKPIVEKWRAETPDLYYAAEPRRGIPVARNCAIAAAERFGADALCFLDDDEVPANDWLVKMVRHWRETGAELIGGPVFVAKPEAGKSVLQRLINLSLAARAKKKNRAVMRDAGQGNRFTIVTNNWLCDMSWLRRVGLRFDEQRLMTGGSDAVFSSAAKALGCKMSWCPEAIVYETMTDDRLSLRYHFFRAASQSINHFQMRKKPIAGAAIIPFLMIAAARAALGGTLLIVPVFGIASPLIAVRSLGWAVGGIRALQGKQSTLYA